MSKYLKYTTLFIALFALFSYNFFDKNIALFFKTNPLDIKDTVTFITRFGNSKYYLIISALVAIISFKLNKKIFKIALYIFSSVALSGILTNIIKIVVARYRPPSLIEQNLYGFNWFEHGYLVNSFPSGHATTAFAFFISLTMLLPKYKIPLSIFASMVAFSRVWLGAHYLSDILIGSMIGTLCATYLYSVIFKEKA